MFKYAFWGLAKEVSKQHEQMCQVNGDRGSENGAKKHKATDKNSLQVKMFPLPQKMSTYESA